MQKERKIVEPRAVWLLFVLCWAVYFSAYIAKRNFSAAMTEMIGSGFLLKDRAGLINTVFFVSYAVGQLCNGMLGDRFRPQRLILIGMLLSGACNLAMGTVRASWMMMPLWAANGYALSMLWPPILRIFCDLLLAEDKLRCSINMSTSVAAGTMISYLLCAGEISLWGWRSTFWLAGGWMLLVGAVWAAAFPAVEKRASELELPQEQQEEQKRNSVVPLRTILLTAPVLMLIVPTLIQGVLRDGVTSWVPTYISENFWADPAFAVLISTLLPIVNLAGPYAARFLQKRWLHTEAATSAALFALSGATLVCLITFGKNSMAGSVVCFGIITASMEGINTMIVSLFPMRFGKYGRTATVSGFFNFITYAGTAISTYGVGLLAERFGWGSALLAWVTLAAAALLICIAVARVQRRGQKTDLFGKEKNETATASEGETGQKQAKS